MPTELRKDLNGLRVRLPATAPIYLIDLGKKRHILNPQVYNELFSTGEGVIDDIDVDEITTGELIPRTAILFRCVDPSQSEEDSCKVFLLDGVQPNQVKRHIISPPVMDRYKFNWDHIHIWNVPLAAIKYPDGSPITNP
jgi:hypothetical protein